MRPGDRALVWVTLPVGGVAAAIMIDRISLAEMECSPFRLLTVGT
jgi:hypothetical protein